ncbi:MAG: ATP-binding protein [Actinomycetota bacterium]|nr:ATP-binding protein [Actinomycetota bacterium]
MKDLKRILILRYTLLIAVVLAATSLLVIIPLRSFTVSREKESLEEQARVFSGEVERLFEDPSSPPDVDLYLETVAGDLSTRLTVVNLEGVVQGDSEADAAEMENHAGRPEIVGALAGRVTSSTRESRTIGKSYIYAAAPVIVDGEIVGAARVSMPEENVMPVVLDIWWIFLGAFGVLLLVVVAVSIWTERTIVGGLRGMSEAAAGLASGDLTRRVAEPDIVDFSKLARDFNLMADRIRDTVEETAAERGKLQAVLNNVSAGVMVTDSDSRIIMLNPAAEEILGVEQDEAVDKRVIEIFSSRELDVTVSRAVAGEQMDEEIELLYPQKRVLHVKSNPVTDSSDRVVATVSAIEDITALKRINQIRQDFVANVSHELRTPVASIKALTDSLVAGAWDQRETAERFLRDMDHEAGRLSQLIEDLLTLSKLEAEEAELKLEDVDIRALIVQCLEAKRNLADEYGVSTEVADAGPKGDVRGDQRLLRTALSNLVDNAIKYNRPGGKVGIEIRDDGPYFVMEVEDSGIGIPREEMPRIFERFYRLDKARSRETGGTGLGLSIVKHIAELHRGDISVKSVEGEGSTFTLRIPRR